MVLEGAWPSRTVLNRADGSPCLWAVDILVGRRLIVNQSSLCRMSGVVSATVRVKQG